MYVTLVTANGAEPSRAFLDALKQHRYGEIGVLYIRQLEQQPDTPPELQAILPLELSSAYRQWSQQTGNPALRARRLEKSRSLFDQFAATHPESLKLGATLAEWGDDSFQRGQQILKWSEKAQDDTQAQLLADARYALQESQHIFDQAVTHYQRQIALYSDPAKTQLVTESLNQQQLTVEDAQRMAAVGLVECKLKIAATRFFVAMTYRNAKSSERATALAQAAEGLKWIQETYEDSDVALRAQFWQARVAQELGKPDIAMDLYDEVLATEPEVSKTNGDDVVGFYALVSLWRVKLLTEVQGEKAVITEATNWIRKHTAWRGSEHFFGISLELAKALLKRAENEPDARKAKTTQDAMSLLGNVANATNGYREEALQLRARLETDNQPRLIANQIALGDLAAEAGRWDEAVEIYAKAVEVAAKIEEPATHNAARERWHLAQYRLAASKFAAGDFETALRIASQFMKEQPHSSYASAVANLEMFAALAKYEASEAQLKSSALEQLRTIASQSQAQFAGEPIAEDALILLAHVEAEQANPEQAVQALQSIPSTSSRFARARLTAGRIAWKQYVIQKKIDDDGDAANHWFATAETNLRAAVERLQQVEVDPEATGHLSEGRTLLAELLLESQRFSDALDVVQPVLDENSAVGGSSKDATSIRALIIGLRASIGQRDIHRAHVIAGALAQSAPDTQQVNAALVDFLRFARAESDNARKAKPVLSGLVEPNSGRDAASESVAQESQRKQLLEDLANRRELTLLARAFIGDYCRALRLTSSAETVWQAALETVPSNSTGDDTTRKVVQQIRFHLADVLLERQQFARALEEIDALLSEAPRALELLTKRGHILQAWAQVDATRYSESAAHWSKLRTLLERVRPRPDQYYDVVYNTAFCLNAEATAKGDARLAQQAEQLLKTTLALHPSLNGPKMVQRFNELLVNCRATQRKSK